MLIKIESFKQRIFKFFTCCVRLCIHIISVDENVCNKERILNTSVVKFPMKIKIYSYRPVQFAQILEILNNFLNQIWSRNFQE
jgi:hypothetical protein